MSEPTVTREDSDRAWRFIGLQPAEADKLAREFAALRERAERAERERDDARESWRSGGYSCAGERDHFAGLGRAAKAALAMGEEDDSPADVTRAIAAALLARDIATAERDTAQRDAAAARAAAAEDAKKAADQRQAFFERLTVAERERDEARALLREARESLDAAREHINNSGEYHSNDGLVRFINRDIARIDAHLNAELAGARCDGCGQPAAHRDVRKGRDFGCCGAEDCCCVHFKRGTGWSTQPLTAPTAQRKGT